ncbi:SIR2 family protein [Clostridium estertheticum]|uniref:SIR2 family protein n=1 Tax=Clostridium estertheticum TaxID=238834 RepID=UPI001C7DCB1C|nr:SIR2 family protein [Clostridium estertheticum]MBX4266217.1 SIR2 family protein [Clostridium estertheticum]WLC89920.1 SIR2 family protein [Clostridium estertheticum]
MKSFINESKRIIRKASENNKLVIFVGAGVSAYSGCPSWKSLVQTFAKGLGIDTKEISSEDYLKIPQYYYNSRKEKEYNDIISNNFNVKVKPNAIHDAIFALKPYHIVTTNYDELLEEAARNKGMFYDVVSKDKDLPYTLNNKMIIKMHGDLKNKNIVLKEDDYLSYFNNFKLIQNYIKALISTYTILFVGYSISDINVKYIFQWVKDILGNDFQQAYFLKVDDSKKNDQIEFDYYKNRGINILYYSEINGKDFTNDINLKNSTDNRGKNTCKFLKYFLDEDAKDKLNIDYAYDRLKNLNGLNKIIFDNIIVALNLETPFEEKGKIIFSHFSIVGEKLQLNTSIVKNLFIEIKKFEDSLKQMDECEDVRKKEELTKNIDFSKEIKINLIKEVFYKAGIKEIMERDEKYGEELFNPACKSTEKIKDGYTNRLLLNYKEKNIDLEKYLLKFDYSNLDEYLKHQNSDNIDGNEEKYLDKAYVLYRLGKSLDAYLILKKLSEICFINKKYLLYFISEFNRYYLGHGISSSNIFSAAKRGISFDMQKSIKKEINTIDLDNIYLNLPSSKRPSLFFLRDILNFKFIYCKIKDTIDFKEKVEKNKDTIYSGIKSNQGEIYKFRRYMIEFWEFITKNRLMLDNYNEVQMVFYNYIESALLSHMTEYREREEKETMFGLPGRIIKLKEIDNFTLFVMIEYLNKKEIEYLFEKYEVNILVIAEKTLEYIETTYNNIINSILMKKNILETKQKLNKFLYIISKINIGKQSFIKIIDGFLEIIDNSYYKDLDEIYKNILNFIIEQNNTFKANICIEKLEQILDYELSKLIVDNDNPFHKENQVIEFIRIIIIVIINKDKKYEFKNDKKIKMLIKKIEIEFNYDDVDSILIPICKTLNDELAENISKIVYEKLNSIEKFNYKSFKLYYSAVVEKVISSSISLEEKAVQFIDESLETKKVEKEKGIYSSSNINEQLLSEIANLIINDLIVKPDRFEKFKDENEKFSFLIDINNYNYDNFKVEWIMYFSEKIHERISKCEKAKLVIKEKLKEKIIENKCDKNIINIFFKYYY